MFTLCVTCIRTRDDPDFKFPAHVVHPAHGKVAAALKTLPPAETAFEDSMET